MKVEWDAENAEKINALVDNTLQLRVTAMIVEITVFQINLRENALHHPVQETQ